MKDPLNWLSPAVQTSQPLSKPGHAMRNLGHPTTHQSSCSWEPCIVHAYTILIMLKMHDYLHCTYVTISNSTVVHCSSWFLICYGVAYTIIVYNILKPTNFVWPLWNHVNLERSLTNIYTLLTSLYWSLKFFLYVDMKSWSAWWVTLFPSVSAVPNDAIQSLPCNKVILHMNICNDSAFSSKLMITYWHRLKHGLQKVLFLWGQGPNSYYIVHALYSYIKHIKVTCGSCDTHKYFTTVHN